MKVEKDVELIAELVASLDEAGEDYVVFAEEEHGDWNWMTTRVPWTSWGRGLWAECPSGTCHECTDDDEAIAVFHRLCQSEQLRMDARVVATWFDTTIPSLETSLASVARHVGTFFEQDMDTWIICRNDGWCIEYYHEGELCFGRVPPSVA